MKNGFTLVELLAIMILLSFITIIVFPIINDSVKKSRQSAYDAQVDLIKESAVKWGIDNALLLPDIGSSETMSIDIDTLVKGGYIKLNSNDNKLYNPINNEEMDGCVVVSYSSEYNQYLYDYSETCTD